MIHYTTVSTQSADATQLIAGWATPIDIAQAQLFKSETRRHDYLLARSALRALLDKVMGPNDWDIIPNIHGKPEISTSKGKQGPHISISHTKGLVACAVSQDHDLGIDVEYWRYRDFKALSEYSFGPREHEEVAREGVSVFYRIWTLREARCKAKGRGLFSSIDGLDHVANASQSGVWMNDKWHYFYVVPDKFYSLAIAFENERVFPLDNIRLIKSTDIL